METNRMYRFVRKMLVDLLDAAEKEKDLPEDLRKTLVHTRAKLEVLDELEGMPPDLSGPGPLTHPYQPTTTDRTYPKRYEPIWPPDSTPGRHQWPYQEWPYQGPGDCPWLEPTITCNEPAGTAGTSAVSRGPVWKVDHWEAADGTALSQPWVSNALGTAVTDKHGDIIIRKEGR